MESNFNVRYLDTMQRSEDEYAALKDQIKAAKAATKKVKRKNIPLPYMSTGRGFIVLGLPHAAGALCKAGGHPSRSLCNKEDDVSYRAKMWLSRS